MDYSSDDDIPYTPPEVLEAAQAAIARILTELHHEEPARMVDFPYHASIRFGGVHRCGGAIINNMTIITVASCTYGYNIIISDNHAYRKYINGKIEPITIRVGTSGGGQVIPVSNIEEHPLYDPKIKPADFDISIMTLMFDMVYTYEVKPILISGASPRPNTGVISSSIYGNDGSSLELTRDMLRIEKCFEDKHLVCAGKFNLTNTVCESGIGDILEVYGKLSAVVSWSCEYGYTKGGPDVARLIEVDPIRFASVTNNQFAH